MACFFPTLEQIENDRMTPPTTGELNLLRLLDIGLDNEYHVYFQSHINTGHPDVVITHPRRGVMIIEVKDWDLSSYVFKPVKNKITIDKEEDKYGSLALRNGEAAGLLSPFEQVYEYKRSLYNLICLELRYALIQNKRAYNIVKNAVYFSQATKKDVETLFLASGQLGETGQKKSYAKFTAWWSRDDNELIAQQIEELMPENELFTPDIYNEMEGIFSLSNEWMEQGEPIELDDNQKKFAEPHPGEKTRISGVAGSGKTLVVAQKAINCYQATDDTVLILTYNITVCNYIRDKIARNTRGMSNGERSVAFEIIHFDALLTTLINVCGLKPIDMSLYRDEYNKIKWDEYQKAQMVLLKNNASKIPRYKTVIIDEAQDYKYAWFSFIEDYVAAEDAEIFIVADEKQNIYSRALGENKRVRIPGFSKIAWQKLDSSYRMNDYNYALALAFQEQFFNEKYELDKKLEKQFQFAMIPKENQGERLYYDLSDAPTLDDLSYMLYRIIRNKCVQEMGISFNDICVLADNVYPLQILDKFLRDANQGTATMFETYEINRECWRNHLLDQQCDDETRKKRKTEFDNEIELLRRMKKKNFRMNPGTVKLSTIYSFKGWEIDTVVLVIDSDDNDEKDELIYTAITRAKRNLIIVNYKNARYVEFIRNNNDLIKISTI